MLKASVEDAKDLENISLNCLKYYT